jgi:hypothetical protein
MSRSSTLAAPPVFITSAEDIRQEIVGHMAEFCRSVRKVDPAEALAFIVADKYLASQAAHYAEAFAGHGIDPRRDNADLLAFRIGVYLDAAGSRGLERLPVFRALHWISLRRAFKSAMGAFASVTGVYHEMHLTCTKV